MTYQSPTIRYQAALSELLRTLVPAMGESSVYGDPRVDQVAKFITARGGTTGWGTASTCRDLKMDISPAYARRLFRRLTGLSMRQFAEEKRMKIARHRLTETDVPVKAIAADAGYGVPHDFTRRFKELFGVTPTEFRKRARENVLG